MNQENYTKKERGEETKPRRKNVSQNQQEARKPFVEATPAQHLFST
jgi:hypothetical protein